MSAGGGVVKRPEQDGTPVLITEAAPSYEEQHRARRRKYAITMSLRFPCLILAGVFYQTWWLALIFLAISVPLPWVAVLIANDRPARKAEKVSRYQREPTMVEGSRQHVIES
jgi:uncharacterized membrane protein